MLTNDYGSVLYVGVTNNLERRLSEHRAGLHDGFTKRYNAHKLVYVESFGSIDDAIAREKQLKGWSRAKKNKLVMRKNPTWEDLSGGQ